MKLDILDARALINNTNVQIMEVPSVHEMGVHALLIMIDYVLNATDHGNLMHEMGVYDLPAVIDYVLNATDHGNLCS
ncbi:hypothetical protein J6590_047278 [Homalodisca vitripennis]|nr:hypothetical protein J6590_047278 [Homalodisca vitripennis]